jgi:hypothetical protein
VVGCALRAKTALKFTITQVVVWFKAEDARGAVNPRPSGA